MELSETAVILGKYAPVYRYALTEEVIRVWHELFAREDAKTFQAAMHITLKESGRTFFPSPGEIQRTLLALNQEERQIGCEVWNQLLGMAGGIARFQQGCR